MSLWTKRDVLLSRNRKTYRLAELLSSGGGDLFGGRDEIAWRAIAMALLDAIWGHAFEHYPTGDLTDAPVAELSDASLPWLTGTEWARRDVRELLLQSGHLDRTRRGRIVVHDWYEWTGGEAVRIHKDRKRKRLDRASRSRKRPSSPRGRGAGQTALEEKREAKQNKAKPSTQQVVAAPAIAQPDLRLHYVLACTVACNEGLHANPAIGDRCNELVASSQTAPLDWYANVIPISLATETIRAVARAYRPKPLNPQPRDLRYFDGAVRDAWERSKQRSLKPAPTPAASGEYSGSAFREATLDE